MFVCVCRCVCVQGCLVRVRERESKRERKRESDALCYTHRQSHCFLKDTAAKGQERKKEGMAKKNKPA